MVLVHTHVTWRLEMSKPIKLNVFFETNGYAEQVATFLDEEVYIECLPILKSVAKERRMFVTDSEMDRDDDSEAKTIGVENE